MNPAQQFVATATVSMFEAVALQEDPTGSCSCYSEPQTKESGDGLLGLNNLKRTKTLLTCSKVDCITVSTELPFRLDSSDCLGRTVLGDRHLSVLCRALLRPDAPECRTALGILSPPLFPLA